MIALHFKMQNETTNPGGNKQTIYINYGNLMQEQTVSYALNFLKAKFLKGHSLYIIFYVGTHNHH